jgi:hypothetical protein
VRIWTVRGVESRIQSEQITAVTGQGRQAVDGATSRVGHGIHSPSSVELYSGGVSCSQL